MVLVACAINFGVNWLGGRLLFGGRAAVGLRGTYGVAFDTALGLGLLGLLTGFLVTSAVRRDVRAGLLPGLAGRLGGPVPEAGWPRALTSLALCVFVGAPLSVLAMGLVAGFPLTGDAYAVWKGGVAAAVALVITPVVAVWAMRDEPDQRDHPGRLRGPLPEGARPLDYLDKGCIAATSFAHGCSNTPTWQLVVRGALDPEHVRQALDGLVLRYPSCLWLVRSVDATPEYARRFVYLPAPGVAGRDLLDFVDLSGAGPGALEALVHRLHDHALDPFAGPMLRVTLARTGPDESRLFFEQHHALADGRAFIGLLRDFAQLVTAAQRGRAPVPELLEPVPRRPELDALVTAEGAPLDAGARFRLGLRGALWSLGVIGRAMVRPTAPLAQNLSNDYTGSNGTVHRVIPEAALDALRVAHKQQGVSLNSLLSAALFRAAGRWSAERGTPPGRTNATLIAETRPRSGDFVSFANHLTSFYAEVDLAGDPALGDVARQIDAQVRDQRERDIHLGKLLAERSVAMDAPVDALRRFVMETRKAPFTLNFSNLIPLDFPHLGGDGWEVTRALVSTPTTPRCGIVLTVVRYRGELVFNFNYKASVVRTEEVTRFAELFEDAVGSVLAAPLPSVEVTFGDAGGRACGAEPPRAPEPPLSWLWDRLARRGAWRWAVSVGALLSLAGLDVGFAADDHMLRVSRVEGAELPGFLRGPLDLFTFSTGDPAEIETLRAKGIFSWWVAPDLQLDFWRPLSSATHALDFALWPDAAWAMSLHSVAWFVAMLLVLGALYRKVHGGAVAAMALLLFAIDDAHGPAIGWISNRNAFIGGTFASAALLAHVAWRRDGWRLGIVVAPLLLGAGLLAAEGAVAALGYLFAWALFVERGRLAERAATLVPAAAVFAGWAAWYAHLGRGTQRSGVYLDPGSEPLAFAAQAIQRIPVLLASQLGGPWSELWSLGPPWMAALLLGVAVAVLAAVIWVGLPLLRESAEARFWLLGAALASVPIAATFPADRLLVLTGVGGMGFMALLLDRYSRGLGFDRAGARGVAMALVVAHLLVAPLSMPLRTRSMEGVARSLAPFDEAIGDETEIVDKTVVVAHAPVDALTSYLPFVRASQRRPIPGRMRLLSTGFGETVVERDGDRSLLIRPAGGFLATLSERMLRGENPPWAVGEEVDLGDVRVEVAEVRHDGRVAAARFHFAAPLDSPSLVWMRWSEGRFVPYTPPGPGQVETLPAPGDFAVLRAVTGLPE
jgi:hypothetical protein